MPRLNNDERKQAIGMLNAGNCCIMALWLYLKDYRAFTRRFRVTGNVADRPRSGRPRLTTAADDRYIVLQHLRNGV